MKQLRYHPLLGADYAHMFPGSRRLQVEHYAVFYQILELEVLAVRVWAWTPRRAAVFLAQKL